MSWSSGKDSTAALHIARGELGVDVAGLLVTVNSAADRIAMHAVRRTLLDAQAQRLGLPVHVVEIPSPCPNELYEEQMTTAMAAAARDGVEAVVFGDIFLQDIRDYREQAMAGTGIRPVFPLWGRETGQLARDMVDGGIRAVLTCVDPTRLPASFAGRVFDHDPLDDLPGDVDACGENGEFHTFVWDGPGFARSIGIETGEIVTRDGFVFCDLVESGRRDAGS